MIGLYDDNLKMKIWHGYCSRDYWGNYEKAHLEIEGDKKKLEKIVEQDGFIVRRTDKEMLFSLGSMIYFIDYDPEEESNVAHGGESCSRLKIEVYAFGAKLQNKRLRKIFTEIFDIHEVNLEKLAF